MQYDQQFLPTVAEALLGRRTYETLRVAFRDLPVAVDVDTLRKVVFPRSLGKAPWDDSNRPGGARRPSARQVGNTVLEKSRLLMGRMSGSVRRPIEARGQIL